MMWKELRTERRGRITLLLERSAMLAVAGLVLYGAARILAAMWLGTWRWGDPIEAYNQYLAIVSPLLAVVLVFQVMVVAAGSVTSERESDTWTALTATTLTAREVVGAKVAGALWRGRGLVALIGLLWIMGVLVGSLDWRVMIAAGVQLGVFATFGACFGLVLSLCLPTTHRAQVLGFGLLLLLNAAGQAAAGIICSLRREYVQGWFPGCMPVALGRSLAFRGPGYWMVGGGSAWGDADLQFWIDAGGVAAYAVGAFVCWRLALARFEVVAGRPRRRSDLGPSDAPPKAALDPIAGPA